MPWCCNLPTGALPSTPSRSIRAGSPIALQAGTRRRAQVLRPSFDWTPVVDESLPTEVAEVVYQDDDSSDQNAYESIGLTMLEDRMMITGHTSTPMVAILCEHRGR